MVKTKAKIATFSATPRDLEMLEVVARYHGLNKSATIVSLVRKEFWRAFPGGTDRIRRIKESSHDCIADRLDDRAIVADGHALQLLEMLLHQRESVQVADPVIERGRTFQVGEEERDILDADSFVAADDLGAEKVAEGLCI